MTGDVRWSPDGELYLKYDLELDDAADQNSGSEADVEFTLDTENDTDKIIKFSKLHQALGVNALIENNGSQNKNVGDNGGGPATRSDYSAGNLYEELSGILSFN